MSERALAGDVTAQIAHESAFWRTDPHERPGADSVENLLNKAQSAAIFREALRPYEERLQRARTVVELGGGQGWASCLVKRLAPAAHVTLTDAVAEAVSGRSIWERVFHCTLDGAAAAPAQAIPVSDGSVDLLFCFAAAHHFVDHPAALRETARVLRPDGAALWLYEPTAPAWIHGAAEARVNRKRPDVPEHVLVPATITRIAADAGLATDVRYDASTLHRGRVETLYYTGLSAVPLLQRLLPCTAHFLFTRR